MYAIGDTAFYGANGVCKIKDIREERFHGEKQMYYILESTIYPSIVLYHPVHSVKSKLKKIILPAIAKQILDVFNNPAGEWHERNSTRNQQYKSVVDSEDHMKTAEFLNTILRKQQELTLQGKKLPSQDAQMAQQISSILYDELSISLDISKNDIEEKINAIISI